MWVAARGALHAATSPGGRHLGAVAYGMPRNSRTPSCALPTTTPRSVFTSSGEECGAAGAAGAAQAARNTSRARIRT